MCDGLRYAECCHTDSDTWYRGKGFCAGRDGGACGDDIVNKQYMASFQLLGFADGEGSFYIGGSFVGVALALFPCVSVAYQCVAANLTVEDFGYALTEKKALVVAAIQFSSPVQRYGHQDVYVIKSATGN